jgi:integrase
LKAVQQAMVDEGLARGVVNQRVGRVKRVLRWAVENELVPAAVFRGLQAVAGLRRGRSKTRETEPVGPVPEGDVEKVLAVLTPTVAALVRCQILTGCRSGEVCRLRPCDLDRSGPVWVYRPARHKTAWRGKPRAVPIGPKAQAVLAPFLGGDSEAVVFSPKRAREERYASLRAKRKSKVQPSQLDRCKSAAKLKRRVPAAFGTTSYGAAVARGCETAGVPHWHPNQLRHSYATEVRKRFGLEAAQVALGHSKADVTQVYAERNKSLAARVVAEMG